ncbi:FEZ2 protein, partial [Anhinga anhinga]|nr:FEZ2 protein [Anhinga anhinga]
IWNALTDNYGNVMPVDWKSSHTRALHLPTLNLSEKGVNDNLNLDLSDDEELREQLDMHSIIVSCINDEPLFTAEQVIEEIEEMMQESPDPEDDETPTQSDRLSILSQEIQTLKRSSTNNSYEETLLVASKFRDLNGAFKYNCPCSQYKPFWWLQDTDTSYCFLREVEQTSSQVRLQAVYVWCFQKYLSLSPRFESLLPERGAGFFPSTRFSMEGISNVIQNGFRHTFGNSGGEKQYLTTVIPYEKKNGPPSVEDLQTLTKSEH